MTDATTAQTGQEGRYYIAASINPDGTFGGGNGYWTLGAPCTLCAPRSGHPDTTWREPCRNPRGHAWSQVRHWQTLDDRRGEARVISPRATSYEEARARAIEICERTRQL